MLHLSLLTPDDKTPSYLLTCSQSAQRTVIDPLDPADIADALGPQPLDLILLTSAAMPTLAAAAKLHLRTGAAVLAGESVTAAARNARLPIARRLGDGEIVGLGPLAQTVALPASFNDDGHPQGLDLTLYAIGSRRVLFTGSLFTEVPLRPLPFVLKTLPHDTLVFGGHAPEATLASAPTLGTLLASPPHAPATARPAAHP